jgi:hypothetical protein
MVLDIGWVGDGSKYVLISVARKVALSTCLGVIRIDNEVVFKDEVPI